MPETAADRAADAVWESFGPDGFAAGDGPTVEDVIAALMDHPNLLVDLALEAGGLVQGEVSSNTYEPLMFFPRGVMMAEALLPHPSGECRCNFPGTIVVCTLDALHDGDHEAPPIELVDGSMSGPVRWPQKRPMEATPMPDSEPLGYAIAEQRPCECGGGCVCGEPGCDRYPPRCEKCDGDGTRWVVTDVKVEPVQHYCERGDDEDAYSEDVRCDPDRADYWLRVRP